MATGCKDCLAEGITTKRKTPHPGPRCSSHHRARRSLTRNTSWERRLMALYSLLVEEFWKIYEHQGRRCFVCQRATGMGKRRLSVDHCHSTGFVRGLLCSTCNKMLGHLRDDPEAFRRAAKYLEDPPAWAVIGKRRAPVEDLTLNGAQDA
jgi:hypothetical protein